MAPAGSRQAFFGTNPIAFGWPRGDDRPPLVFDQATAAMARGEVMIAARDGKELPPGVGLGPDGQPSTDPKAVLEGVLLPFGGYKGSAISMMVELLAAGLIGAVVFLFVGAMTIFGAAVRESVLAPGQEPDRKRRLQATIATGLAGAGLAVILDQWQDDRIVSSGGGGLGGQFGVPFGAGDAKVGVQVDGEQR